MSYKNLEPLNKLVKGYMVRKYKRGFPLHVHCNCCLHELKGTIHRSENKGDSELIIYKSEYSNKGYSSYSHEPISTVVKVNSEYYCDNCITSDFQKEECPICLTSGGEGITITKCNHTFHLECLSKWIKTSNQTKNVFEAICPLCRKDL